MPVSLTSMRDNLYHGVCLMEISNKQINVDGRFPHILNLVKSGAVSKYKDLQRLPKSVIGYDGTEYCVNTVWCGREYSQWNNRIIGPAPELDEDGKCDVFREEKNEHRKQLDLEIRNFTDMAVKSLIAPSK